MWQALTFWHGLRLEPRAALLVRVWLVTHKQKILFKRPSSTRPKKQTGPRLVLSLVPPTVGVTKPVALNNDKCSKRGN